MIGFIYKHTSPSGKSYIGQTTLVPKIRWKKGSNYKGCTAFYSAIKKYGWENFISEILEEIEFDDIAVLNKLEEKYVIQFNTLAPYGYNLKAVGENTLTAEITKVRKTKHYVLHKEKQVSVASLAKEYGINPQTLFNRVFKFNWALERALTEPATGRKGKKHTDESKKKQSDAKKGKKMSKEFKEKQRTIHIKHIIEYKGKRQPIVDFAKQYGITPSTLRDRILKFNWPVAKAIETPIRKKINSKL